MSLFSETLIKPKLLESKLKKHIIEQQLNEVTYESKIYNYIFEFLKTNYMYIIGALIIISLLYYRYRLTQEKRALEKKNIYDDDSDYYTSDE
jgi:hypothetical protein